MAFHPDESYGEYPSFELFELIDERLCADESALDPLWGDLGSTPAHVFGALSLPDPCDVGLPATYPATQAPAYDFSAPSAWDIGSSSPSYSTPPLTPDRPPYTLPRSLVPANCDGLPAWGLYPDSTGSDAFSPMIAISDAVDEVVRAMCASASDSDTLATPSPTVSTSDLSTGSPTSGCTSIEEEDDDYGASPGESDSDSDMDSEYAPSEGASPRSHPASKRRARQPKSTRPAPSTSRCAKPTLKRPAKRTRTRTRTPRPAPHHHAARPSARAHARTARACSTKSRMRQVAADHPCPEPVDFRCPICGHRQTSRRAPDLRRHIDAHYAKARGDWVCCGVPVADALERGVRSLRGARTWPETGLTMVGGCGQRFARKDAYKRHLGAGKGRNCYGDPTGSWLPGIKREREHQHGC